MWFDFDVYIYIYIFICRQRCMCMRAYACKYVWTFALVHGCVYQYIYIYTSSFTPKEQHGCIDFALNLHHVSLTLNCLCFSCISKLRRIYINFTITKHGDYHIHIVYHSCFCINITSLLHQCYINVASMSLVLDMLYFGFTSTLHGCYNNFTSNTYEFYINHIQYIIAVWGLLPDTHIVSRACEFGFGPLHFDLSTNDLRSSGLEVALLKLFECLPELEFSGTPSPIVEGCL